MHASNILFNLITLGPCKYILNSMNLRTFNYGQNVANSNSPRISNKLDNTPKTSL